MLTPRILLQGFIAALIVAALIWALSALGAAFVGTADARWPCLSMHALKSPQCADVLAELRYTRPRIPHGPTAPVFCHGTIGGPVQKISCRRGRERP